MGFTAGSNINVGVTVSHTQWNAYNGVAGSIDYLKTEADKVDACSMSANLADGSTRVLGTNYQNTTGKTIVVSVKASAATSGKTPVMAAYVELGDTTPDVLVARVELDDVVADNEVGSLTFVVPPSAYYKVASVTGLTLQNWYEWGLF